MAKSLLWKAAADAFAAAKPTPGTRIHRKELAVMFGLTVPPEFCHQNVRDKFDLAFMSNMKEFRSYLLREYKIYLTTNFDSTYRVVSPTDQAKVAAKEFGTKAMTKLNQMYEGIAYTDQSMFTAKESAKLADTLAHAGYVRSVVRKELRKINAALAQNKPEELKDSESVDAE